MLEVCSGRGLTAGKEAIQYNELQVLKRLGFNMQVGCARRQRCEQSAERGARSAERGSREARPARVACRECRRAESGRQATREDCGADCQPAPTPAEL